jgi:hypothetical protein
VVVDGDGQRALGGLLPDDVLVEDVVDLDRLRKVLELEARRDRELLVDDLVAEIDALVTDVDAWPGDQLLDLPLRLAAEAAEKLLVRVGWTCQGLFPFGLRVRMESARKRLRNLSSDDVASITPYVAAPLQGAARLQPFTGSR